ncbi:MAG TPA: DUF1839 family protein [Polyangiaceae bacterium]|nr:DUF1839 family protein [Polyangiaceae bacterium]
MTVHAFAPLDPKTYVSHELHRSERAWTESNCYIDVWIEVLHALELDPCACLPHVLPVDYEGDQWTFFKPSHDDLYALYGLQVHELNVWRPLVENVRAQLTGGRLVLSEVDAYYLPDTAGTDYRKQHTKTTIGIQAIDVESRTLGYFHNSGYHALGDADFAAIFRVDAPPDPAYMPFFAEFVRLDRRKRLEPRALLQESLRVLAANLARRPSTNPVARFRERFSADLEWLQREGLPTYHAWAFATLRQLGAAFELGALYVRWLSAGGEHGLDEVIASFNCVSDAAKALVLKTARAVNAKKPLDAAAMLGDAERAWSAGMTALVDRYGA